MYNAGLVRCGMGPVIGQQNAISYVLIEMFIGG